MQTNTWQQIIVHEQHRRDMQERARKQHMAHEVQQNNWKPRRTMWRTR